MVVEEGRVAEMALDGRAEAAESVAGEEKRGVEEAGATREGVVYDWSWSTLLASSPAASANLTFFLVFC